MKKTLYPIFIKSIKGIINNEFSYEIINSFSSGISSG